MMYMRETHYISHEHALMTIIAPRDHDGLYTDGNHEKGNSHVAHREKNLNENKKQIYIYIHI